MRDLLFCLGAKSLRGGYGWPSNQGSWHEEDDSTMKRSASEGEKEMARKKSFVALLKEGDNTQLIGDKLLQKFSSKLPIT